ncbi:hypothetical protein FBQ82_14970 [Anaerolineae bacterium CFX7]|nr:hypothetical protein [Anaerolineae bacterium CFX7]
MKITKRKVLIGAFVLMGILGAMLLTTQSAYLAPLFVQGETESYRYTAQGERNNLYITVSVNFDDAATLQKYRRVNQRRGEQLSKQNKKDIPLLLTFAHPLPLAQARELVRQTDLDVSSYMMVGHSSLSGERGTYINFETLEQDVELARNVDSTGNGEQLLLEGVMVIQARLRDSSALGKLLRDERIYLVDTTEFEVRELLSQRHAAMIKGKAIDVTVPSPFWNLDW